VRWLLVAIVVCGNICGDLLNTYGMKKHGEVHHFGGRAIARLAASLARNWYVVGGTVAMAVSFFAMMSLLSIEDLSFAVPATASSYIVETVLAKLILGEQVHWQRWTGALVVAGGVLLLAL
jgi:drug/metabolite transporter (DMT)-like permease